MGFLEIVTPILDAQRQSVLQETWGHLAPKPKTTYKGFIIFCLGAWGDIVPIESQFEDLDSSPWFYDDLKKFIRDYCIEMKKKECYFGVFKFVGTYRKFKSGSSRFSGKITQINLDIK
jgi:hypothetical protein